MIDATDADVLGDNTSDLVIDEAAPQTSSSVPPPPPLTTTEVGTPIFAMAPGELFTRDQYHAAGWTDDQMVQAGKMSVIAPPPAKIDLISPVGMPESKYVVLDDNDDIPPTGLFIGHNGIGFMLQTGVPAMVPTYILDVLDDAVMDAPVIDPRTRQVTGYRPRPRYTYREVPAPADA